MTTFFRLIIVFEFSLNAVECVSGQAFHKKNITTDNIFMFFNCGFFETFAFSLELVTVLSFPVC